MLVCTLAACTDGGSAGPGASSGPATPIPGCPATTQRIESLLSETITHSEGAVSGSNAQVCAFSTDSLDVSALSVVYLRFPRDELEVKTLAGARRVYGSALAGHTVVSKPSWGPNAFLDESTLPGKNLIAEFAWVPGFEVILGMHVDDPHVPQRRRLIDEMVALTR